MAHEHRCDYDDPAVQAKARALAAKSRALWVTEEPTDMTAAEAHRLNARATP